jgi:hypothetical protein
MNLQLKAKYEKNATTFIYSSLLNGYTLLNLTQLAKQSQNKMTHTATQMQMHIQRSMVADMQYRPTTPG